MRARGSAATSAPRATAASRGGGAASVRRFCARRSRTRGRACSSRRWRARCEAGEVRGVGRLEGEQPQHVEEREELRRVLTRALAVAAAPGIPQGRWEGPPAALVEALVGRIDQEMVDEVWSRIYRSVEVRPPTVRDRYHNMYRLGVEDDFRQHWALRGAALELAPVRSGEPTLLLVCDFSAAERAELSGEFVLPVAEDEFLGITLPLRQDPASQHVACHRASRRRR